MLMVTAPSTGAGTLSRVSPYGKVTDIATLAGTFIGPGIDVDGDGNSGKFVLTSLVFDFGKKALYVRDNTKILKFEANGDGTLPKPEVVTDKLFELFCICLGPDGTLYASSGTDKVLRIGGGQAVKLTGKPVSTCVGLAAGGKGFDENCLYVAVADGIVEIPIK
jgi:hypothetical protein